MAEEGNSALPLDYRSLAKSGNSMLENDYSMETGSQIGLD